MKKPSPKKRGAKLGQHFLTNSGIAQKIAIASGAEPDVAVYEIGPGKGVLTRELLLLGARVTAIEKDPEMVSILQENFSNEIRSGQLTVLLEDARNATPDVIFPRGDYVIAANIPYYITGELIRTALTSKNQPKQIALLIQKEVAERIARAKKESILSLSVKVFGTPKYIQTVSRGSFSPPPAVDSAVLQIQSISRENFARVSETDFFRTLKAGFAQKRKTLAGNLKKVFGERASVALIAAGLSDKVRAEDVKLEEWLTLARALSS